MDKQCITLTIRILMVCLFVTPIIQTSRAQPTPTGSNQASQGGAGLRLTTDNNGSAVVDGMLPGGSAETAGVQVGDVIIEVDGNAVTGADAAAKIRGTIGSDVKLSVRRNGRRVDLVIKRTAITGLQQADAPQVGASGYTVSPNTTALTLMPELKTAPAPAWVKPGMRIAFAGVDGVTPGAGGILIATPDGRFKLQNGQSVEASKLFTGAGRGIMVADIVAVHDDAVVLEIRSNVYNGTAAILTAASENGLATTPGAASGGWIHPDVLQKHIDANGPNVTVQRMPYTAAGKSYNAIGMQTITAQGSSATVYDLESGLLLHSSTTSTTATQTARDNQGNPVTGGGQTYMTNGTLAEIRETKSPWEQGRLPKSLDGVHQLTFDGQQVIQMPGIVPMPPSAVRIVYKVTGRGSDFMQVHRTFVVAIGATRTPFETDIVSGPAQLMPLAVDPTDLSKLRQGQQLDSDPVTKAVISVSFIGHGPRGNNVVAITEAIPGEDQQHIEFVYDRETGLVIQMSLTNPFLHQVTQVALTGKD